MTSVIDLSSDKTFSFIGQITSNMFEVIDKVGKIKCPFFIVHGSADDIIDISHSQKIAKQVTANLWKYLVIESGGHLNLESEFDDEFLEDFVSFIQSLSPHQANSHSKLKRSPSMVPGTIKIMTCS
jgi:esterase/lipase